MSRVAKVALGLLGLMSIAAVAWWLSGRGAETEPRTAVDVADVRRTEVADFVRATGRIESVREEIVRVNEPRLIERLFVEEGQRVSRGTRLVELGVVNPTREGDELEARELAYEAAQIREKAARSKHEVAKALYEAGAEARARVAETSLALEAAVLDTREALRALQQVRRRLDRPAGAESRATGTRVLTAGMDGTVTGIAVREGTYVDVGQEIVRLADLDRLEVVAEVDEFDAARVEVGQEATVSFEAIADKTYAGEVKSIAPRVRIKEGRSVVPVRIRISGDTSGLRVANRVDVELRVANRPAVLSIPISALVQNGTKVWSVREGQARAVAVVTGLVGIQDVEIQEGLSEGELVIVRPDARIREGTEVLPR